MSVCSRLDIPLLFPEEPCQFADIVGIRKLITIEKARLKKKARALENHTSGTAAVAFVGSTPATPVAVLLDSTSTPAKEAVTNSLDL